jgi:hypothetical protein
MFRLGPLRVAVRQAPRRAPLVDYDPDRKGSAHSGDIVPRAAKPIPGTRRASAVARNLSHVSLVLVMAAIIASSVDAPYRVVQLIVAVGLLTLVLQVPDTVEQWRAIRNRDVDARSTGDEHGDRRPPKR